MGYKRILTDKDKEKCESLALAIVCRDMQTAISLGLSENYYRLFVSFAACYTTKAEGWDKKYAKLNKNIMEAIKNLIDTKKYQVDYTLGPRPSKIRKHYVKKKGVKYNARLFKPNNKLENNKELSLSETSLLNTKNVTSKDLLLLLDKMLDTIKETIKAIVFTK